MTEQLQSRGLGSTFVELSTEGLASFPVSVPPLREQRSIADYLDAETARLDGLVAKLGGGPASDRTSLCGLLIERRHALVTAAVNGQLASTKGTSR
jgi:type I restriction enzyme S subunit